VGEYEHPGYGELEVNLHSNQLVAVFNAMKIPLEHWHYDVFNAVENATDEIMANKKFNFATDVNGNISSVAVRFDDKAKEIMLTRKVDPRLSDTNYLARFVGEYDLSGHVLKVSLAGGGLRLDIPGERHTSLCPISTVDSPSRNRARSASNSRLTKKTKPPPPCSSGPKAW